MLSKTEKEYLDGIEAFEDMHGLGYAQVVRHRIRKRVASALEDLSYVIDRNGSKRKPAKKFRERNKSIVKAVQPNRSGMKDEVDILFPDKFTTLIFQLVKRDNHLGDIFIDSIKIAQEEVAFATRTKLLDCSTTELYAKEWIWIEVERRFRRCDDLIREAGFDNMEDCIKWLTDAKAFGGAQSITSAGKVP